MLAEDQVDFVSGIVSDKLKTVFAWAEKARTAAEGTINSIGMFPVPVIHMNLPLPPKLGTPISPNASDVPRTTFSLKPVSVSYQETAQVQFVTPPELPTLVYGTAVAPPPAPTDPVPQPPTLYPQVAIPAIPDQPDLFDPAEPTITNADAPELLYVDVPDFTFPTLPPFDAPVPVYKLPTPIVPIAPIMPVPELPPSELTDRVLELLGGTNEDLEETRLAMIDRLVEKADIEAQTAVEAAFNTAAARNFSLPHGVLVDGVNEIRHVSARKIRDGMSEINTKIAQEALKNYQAGMELALVLEKAYISLYLEYARQVLEAEKLNVQIVIEMFNATVALFNAQQQVRQIHASAHRAHVQGIIAGMGAYPTAISGAVAETEENTQRIQMYAADGGLVKARTQVYSATTKKEMAPIDTYKAEVGGVKAQADIIAANVDAYRAAVHAYATGVGATVEVIGGFSNETMAKTSQVNVHSSNAKAYAQYVQEGSKRANTWRVFANAQGDVLRANVHSYQEAAEANQSFVRAQTAKISAEAEIAGQRQSAYASGLNAAKTYNRATMDNAGAAQTYSMVAAENLARIDALAAIAQAETDRINAGALAAQTQALAALAQGSMSALHVSASASGAGTLSANADWKSGASLQWGGRNSYDERHEEHLSV